MQSVFDIMSPNRYFELLGRDNLTEQERIGVTQFETYMAQAERYKDYLVDNVKTNRDAYESGISQLGIIEATNPNIPLTANQKRAIDAYNQQKSNLREIKENGIKKLTRKNDISAGYTNAFGLVLSVLATGILIGISLFMFTK